MNNLFKDVIDKNTTPFNKDVVEGLAVKMLPDSPEYIDSILANTIKSVNHLGIEYHGWRRLTPNEEYNSLFNAKNAPIVFDVAESSLFKIELDFSMHGKPFKRYLYLPYVDRGGIMKISDTSYYITPVLSDTVISPNYMEVFVRLLKDKLSFKRVYKNILIDGIQHNGQIIYSHMVRTANRGLDNTLGNIVPPIALYLPAINGIHGAMKKYFDSEIIVTTDAVTPADYPDHNIYSSIGIPVKGYKLGNYIPTRIKFIVPKDKRNQAMDTFISGILYAFDAFPFKDEDLIEVLKGGNLSTERDFWKLFTGLMIFKDTYSITKTFDDMNDHFGIIDSYLDTLIAEKLAETNIFANDYYDLLFVIMDNYNDWLLNSKEFTSNIYNRYLDIKYYLLYDIIAGINTTVAEINRRSSKTRKALSEQEVMKIFTHNLSPKRIYKILKDGMNISLVLVDSSGDNMFYKVTSQLEDRLVFCSDTRIAA